MSGRWRSSASETVTATWLRADSSTGVSAFTVIARRHTLRAQHDRELERAPDRQRELPGGNGEARPTDGDSVAAYPQVGESETPVLVCSRCARQVRLGVPCDHLRTRHDGSRRVHHAPADTGVINCLLRQAWRRRREQRAHDYKPFPYRHDEPRHRPVRLHRRRRVAAGEPIEIDPEGMRVPSVTQEDGVRRAVAGGRAAGKATHGECSPVDDG